MKTKYLDAGVRDPLSKIIARVLFPILMFCIFLNPDISVGQIWDSRYLLLTAVGWVVVSFLIGIAAAKLLKLDRRRGPVFFILLGMSNVTYMGLPCASPCSANSWASSAWRLSLWPGISPCGRWACT